MTAAAAGRTLFAGLGGIDGEGAAVNGLAVEGGGGFLGLLGGAHGDEGEPAGTAGGPVHHQVGFQDGAMGGEGVLQVVFCGVEGKVSDKQFIVHYDVLTVLLTVAFSRLFPDIGIKIITELSSPEDS